MTRDVNDVMHRKRARKILGDFKKSVELSPAWEEDGWLSLARRGLVSGAHVVWGRWKSQVYLSPYVEKLFNSKVIKKSFVPELRSRHVFFVFQDSYVLCIYVRNILCTFPIFMYGYVTPILGFLICLACCRVLLPDVRSSSNHHLDPY